MESKLWNIQSSDSVYNKDASLYKNHILEQYKLYVEMADRISLRRNRTSVFFLTMNTTILTVIGLIFTKITVVELKLLMIFPIIAVIVLNLVWWLLIRSYRNLNSAKYKVIGLLEKRLPCSPYWSAEWKELGEGKSLKKFLPLTVLENIVPFVFSMLYITIAIYCLILL